MTTHIALLRGINVSGQKKIMMEALRTMMRELGFEAVTTYIQSGNVVFRTKVTDAKDLRQSIAQQIEQAFGHKVPVLVLSIKELLHILDLNPFRNTHSADQNMLYYVLLLDTPLQDGISALNDEKFEGERFSITTDCVYLCCQNGYGNAKLNNNLVERKLKVLATTRNHATMIKLIEIANSIS
jgi:uncharacterized protein (DUF1697 family)